jgi:hypothetical protein
MNQWPILDVHVFGPAACCTKAICWESLRDDPQKMFGEAKQYIELGHDWPIFAAWIWHMLDD